MPGDYILLVERKLVFSRAFGVLTDADLRDHARQLKGDPRLDPSFRQFADFSALTDLRVTTSGVRSISGVANPFLPGCVRAILVPTSESFGMARMFQMWHGAAGMLVTARPGKACDFWRTSANAQPEPVIPRAAPAGDRARPRAAPAASRPPRQSPQTRRP